MFIADEIIKATDTLADFPYAYPVYNPIRPINTEYRKLIVQNYMVFYSVDEKTKQLLLQESFMLKEIMISWLNNYILSNFCIAVSE